MITHICDTPVFSILTLNGLSLFFKILPISNTGVSILATVHFLYPKLGSFSDMEYYFYQLAYQDSKVPKQSTLLAIFMGLSLIPITSIWSAS